MMLLGFLFCVFMIVLAMLWQEGFWTNTITFFNVLFAGAFATNYFEPLAEYFDIHLSQATYLWDVLAFWLIFAAVFSILRAVTARLSRYKVKFKLPVEIAGNAVSSAAVAYLMVVLLTFSIHFSPLSRHPFRGGFQQTPDASNLLIFYPDLMWMWGSSFRSTGALSALPGTVAFDPQRKFIQKYYHRRARLEQQDSFLVESQHKASD